MAKLNKFNDLKVWQKAHKLVLSIYALTSSYPKHELFAITSQARRSATSIPSNIVEGFRRKSLRDSIRFYNIADASLEELKYHILLSKDLTYISINQYKHIANQCEEVGMLLTRWIQSQKKFIA